MRSRDTLDAQALARLLAPLLYLKEVTILRNLSRKPQSLPPPVQTNSGKIWVVDDVVNFYPPAIRAVIRRAIAREFQDKISSGPAVDLPAMRSIADDLAACGFSRVREKMKK